MTPQEKQDFILQTVNTKLVFQLHPQNWDEFSDAVEILRNEKKIQSYGEFSGNTNWNGCYEYIHYGNPHKLHWEEDEGRMMHLVPFGKKLVTITQFVDN